MEVTAIDETRRHARWESRVEVESEQCGEPEEVESKSRASDEHTQRNVHTALRILLACVFDIQIRIRLMDVHTRIVLFRSISTRSVDVAEHAYDGYAWEGGVVEEFVGACGDGSVDVGDADTEFGDDHFSAEMLLEERGLGHRR